jgi:hypothetical protein
MMGSRDGAAHLKGTFATDPPSVAMSYPPLFRLVRESVPVARLVREGVGGRVPPPVEIEIGGLSSQAEGQFALRLDSPANTNYVVVAGFDQDGDGDLSAGEVVSVLSDRGRTYLSGGLLAYPVSSPNIWSDDYHVKVVNRTVYELYRAAFLTGALGFDAVVPRAFGSKMLMAFLTGDPLMVPTSLPNPIPFIPAPRGPDFELRPDTAVPKYSHNTGVLWPEDGVARIPHYILDHTTAIPDLILRSDRFHDILDEEIGFNARRIRAVIQNVGDVQTFQFRRTRGVEFGGGSGCLSIPDVDPSSPRFATALLEAFTACTDFDLFVGIGGADCDFTITVTFRGRLDPLSGTVVAVEEGPVRVQGKISDLYDWNFDKAFPDTFTATVQAGFGTLGEGGRIFFTEIPLDGEAGELGIVIR